MQSLATKIDAHTTTGLAGHVVRREGESWVVRVDREEYRARRAASCLLEPAVGDRVLVAAVADGSAYVLAVLERDAATAAVLSVDGDLSLRATNGSIDLAARDAVTIASATDATVVAPRVELKALEGTVAIDELTVVGARILAEVVNVKAIAETIDSFAERISQRAKRMYRFVEELDQLKAKNIDYTAQKALHMHGANSLVTADKLVKVDGEHIHMG